MAAMEGVKVVVARGRVKGRVCPPTTSNDPIRVIYG